MKLKIFSDQEYLFKGMEADPMLYPFWLKTIENHKYPWLEQYNCYMKSGFSLFEMVSLEEADFAVVPANWRTIRGDSWRTKINKQAMALSIQFANKAEQAKKPVIVFFSGDCSDEEIPIKNAHIFRQGIYRSEKKPNDFVLPSFCEDLVEHYLKGQLPIRQKSKTPTVGFCGLAKQFSWKTSIKTVFYQGVMLSKYGKMKVSPYKGHNLRTKVLKALANSSLINTNFITRDRLVFLIEGQLDQRLESRYEFVQNMVESDYILCCRGSANCSTRLYEALCCGRIPIFINTDCVLPYEFAIDWRKYCVWVEEKEIPQIEKKVTEFHNNLSSEEFVELQHECRRLWKQWLSPEGFFSNFYRHFQGDMPEKPENISRLEPTT